MISSKICQAEHTRHRYFLNFIINLLSALTAFSFFDKKSSINTVWEIVHPSFLHSLSIRWNYIDYT